MFAFSTNTVVVTTKINNMVLASNQVFMLKRKLPSNGSLFWDVMKKTRCDDDAVRMYCNEAAKVADGYKDSDESRSREYKREKSVVMKLVDKNSLLSPPKSLKSRTIQQPKLFKFELHGENCCFGCIFRL